MRSATSVSSRRPRSASALNHPNIVTIHEIGSTDSTIYIAMELLEGRTLREVLHGNALPTKKLLDLACQISDGLARAHAAGIVHRDLKPENVMVSRDGVAKILDFGLAKLVKSSDGEASDLPTRSQGTQAGAVMGTADYMSPEQASGKPVDFRTDQFSAGIDLLRNSDGEEGVPSFDERRNVDRDHSGRSRAGRPDQSFRSGAVSMDRRALPAEGSRGALRLDAGSRAGRPGCARPSVGIRGFRSRLGESRRVPGEAREASGASGCGPRRNRGRAPPGNVPREENQPLRSPLVSADHVRKRHDPFGPVRPGRANPRLQRLLERRSPEDLLETSEQP